MATARPCAQMWFLILAYGAGVMLTVLGGVLMMHHEYNPFRDAASLPLIIIQVLLLKVLRWLLVRAARLSKLWRVAPGPTSARGAEPPVSTQMPAEAAEEAATLATQAEAARPKAPVDAPQTPVRAVEAPGSEGAEGSLSLRQKRKPSRKSKEALGEGEGGGGGGGGGGVVRDAAANKLEGANEVHQSV